MMKAPELWWTILDVSGRAVWCGPGRSAARYMMRMNNGRGRGWRVFRYRLEGEVRP